MVGRPAFSELAAKLAAVRSGRASSTDAEIEEAGQLLRELGIDRVLDELDVAERIILAGESFHSVERFFVDGSVEQRFVVDLVRRAKDSIG